MEKICGTCGKVLNIPEDKIPSGKAVIVTCPGCKDKIRIVKDSEDSVNLALNENDLKEAANNNDDFGDPFDFLEEEGDSALICINDNEERSSFETILNYMEYSVHSVEKTHEALRELRLRGDFSLILVDENFDCEDVSNNAVLKYSKRLSMRDRRNIYIVLLSDSRRTFDRKDAFAQSVNLVINRAHLEQFEDLVKKGISEWEIFYKNFKEVLKKGLRI